MTPALTPHEPPLRVMSLHALAYCRRLFYLEEVEGIRVADHRVYAGRELHASLEDELAESHESFELASEKLGLIGKVDAVRYRDGYLVPFEHKRGRCRREEKNQPTAWPSDRVQLASYAMLLEEAFGKPIPEGRVRYHADNVTVRIAVDDQLRNDVLGTIEAARLLRRSVDRPPIAENERLCRSCSLAPVCLPEEMREDDSLHDEAPHYYPPVEQRTTLHVASQGASIGRSGDQLVVTPHDGQPTRIASNEIAAVLVHGFSQISTQAIRLCVDKDIAVHWLTTGGMHIASLTSSPGQVQRRIRQYRALADEVICMRLTKQLVRAKLQGQHRYLLRATRGPDGAKDRGDILPNLRAISESIEAAMSATDRDSIRGHEGQAALHYFASLPVLLAKAVPASLRYTGRSRQPTLDRFSAMLNFGYALLQTAVMRAVLATGLEPAFGFYHTPRSAAHPLVLDLMELFRAPLWDMVVIASLNRGQWDPQADFVETRPKVWLSDTGKRKAIDLFESRLQETWKHPVVNCSLSYLRTIELEARLLEKEWTGEPGHFARLRIR